MTSSAGWWRSPTVLGQVTTLAYDLGQDPLKITRVTDPFGRTARFTYDANGFLQTITDTINLTSSFTYGADGVVTAMTTPYGTTRFTTQGLSTTRIVDVTDPLGGRERIEFQAQTDGMAAADPATTVPTVPGTTFVNDYLQYRNTYYWNKRAMLLGAGDRSKAHLYHWLHKKDDINLTSGVLESEKAPLERRIWYRYRF